MRNVFDQYSQPENRLTHALACTLNADRSLLRPFIRWCGIRNVPHASQLRMTEQSVPGEEMSGDETEGRGLPDICIFDQDSWVLMIESKVQCGVSVSQIRRHLATASRHAFDKRQVLLLCVDNPPANLPAGTTVRSWRDLYAWFRRRAAASGWATRLTDYMETFESRMIAEDYSIRGTITMFDGLRFDRDNPYSYREAKRMIRLLGDELQARRDLQRLGVDPKGKRRTAITGRRSNRGVWDFLPLKAARGSSNFTGHPHLTLVIRDTGPRAAVTIPNGVRGGFRTQLKEVGEDGFVDLLRTIERRLRPTLKRSTGSKCMLYALQRHYRSQRSEGEIDARLDADLRTVVPGSRRSAKFQPEWTHAIYEVITRKRSNIQLGLEVHFTFDCPIIRSARAPDLFADAWKAMLPMVEFALGR